MWFVTMSHKNESIDYRRAAQEHNNISHTVYTLWNCTTPGDIHKNTNTNTTQKYNLVMPTNNLHKFICNFYGGQTVGLIYIVDCYGTHN